MGVERCSERYKVKGVMGCVNRHVEEEMLVKAYLMAWNALVENRENVKMKRSKKRCQLGVEIPDWLFFLLFCRW